jgi:hypothetical protein
MLIFTTLFSPILAGLIVLWAAVRLANPRVGWPESLLLGLLLGQAALLTPAAALAPLWVALGLSAVWPVRALAVFALGGVVAVGGALQGTLLWPTLTPLGSRALMVAGGAVLAMVLAYQLYHWRWWPPLRHALVGLSATTLLFVSSGIGALPSVVVMSLLLAPLPLWAWWLAKQRQPF